MNNDSHKQDGFYELMQTQQLQEIPSLLESTIMQKIEVIKETKSSPIRIQAVIIFSLQMCTYVIISFIGAYYFPHSNIVNDIKTMIFIGALVHFIYELNEMVPNMIKRKLSI
jgi:hypothetical protein